MNWLIKEFNELTTKELHDIYKIRTSVFVVEQQCPYQEIDEFDTQAFHIALIEKNEIVAYCRLLPPNCTYEDASIGRVLSTKRREGLATIVLEKAIELSKKEWNTSNITIGAQVYARHLYEKLGFVQISDLYLEDDIPHIKMKLRREEK